MQSSEPIAAKHIKNELRVLFFEDDAEDIELSLRALRAAQFAVTSDNATTLDEFRERLHSNHYDVILSDYRMPGTTGMDAFEVTKAAGVDTPFILVTGLLGDEMAVECLKQGVADYVLKDRIMHLPVAIRRALEQQRMLRERERDEQALRRSEASYRSLIQSAPCGILRLNASNGRLLELNPALAEMLGYDSPADLLGADAANNVALAPQVVAALLQQGGRNGSVEETEIEWKRADGVPLTIRLSGRLLRDREGVPACLEMIAENVTERRLAEARIGQLNRLYSVLSHAGQAIVRIRESTALFREICRVVVEEGGFQMAWVGLAGTETDLVRPVASCGDRQDLEGISTTAAPAARGPVATAILENRHVVCIDLAADPHAPSWPKRDLRHSYGSAGVFPIAVDGRTIGAIAIYASARDSFDDESVALLDELSANVSFALQSITAEQMHQRAEDELNRFFALSLDMLCICNLEGYIYRLNPAWEKTLGFTPAEMCSKPWVEFVHPEDRPRALAIAAGFAGGVPMEGVEIRFVSKDGSYRWLTGSATPVVEHGMVCAAVRDITDSKRLEDRLRSQNVELERQNCRVEEASRMKSEFLANMSHELRSPLNGIIGFTELLYDGKVGPLPERPRELLNRIHKSAKHLLQLINDVLDLSKVEAGRIDLRNEQVCLLNIIQEVTGILAPMAGDKKILIETVVAPEVNDVIADGGRLKQILYNYLSNALKFTGEGGRVTVSASLETATEFRLAVEDSGIGIAEKDLPLLFTEFHQIDSSSGKRYQGTGLGLALTKHIVEAQGGRVGVETSPGKGSTFFAVLPKDQRPAGNRPTILVVEDEAIQCLLLTRTLQYAGYAVETAATSSEAIAKCREHRYDAITLDVMLPDGLGLEALSRIRSLNEHRKTPVIVISGLGNEATACCDIQGYLSKPVDGKDLLALLDQTGVFVNQ